VKITLVQMRLEPGSRSANLSAALRRIDDAADLTPSPDLILLPGCADHGGTLAKAVSPTDARGGAFCETLALKARDLGLYIATGHVDADFDDVYLAASLFDADGDTVLLQRAVCPTPVGEAGRGTTLQVRDTIFGRVGLLVGPDASDAILPRAMARLGARLLIVAGLGGQAPSAGELARLARDCEAWIVVAHPASPTGGAGERSAVYSPSGECTATAPTGAETDLTVEVAVPRARGAAAR
jgi:predicted amidohydrolase